VTRSIPWLDARTDPATNVVFVATEGRLWRPRRTGSRAKTGQTDITMSKLLRGAVAGVGAWKLGGGIFGTILLFVLLWIVLGNFDIFR